jgi:O-antigen/teichoic acid export membrane protein
MLAIGLVAAAAGAYVHVFTNFLKGNLLTTIVSIVLLLLLYATPPNRGKDHLRIAYFMGFTTLAGMIAFDCFIDIFQRLGHWSIARSRNRRQSVAHCIGISHHLYGVRVIFTRSSLRSRYEVSISWRYVFLIIYELQCTFSLF